MNILWEIVAAFWDMLLDAAPYLIFGIIMGGLLKVFLSPDLVARHLGQGRFSSVFKAALFGIPLPLCSCGVLPAAAALKKQGANNGATAAFLISTPESGVDSIAASYALLDPLMTVARPVAALITAMVAGIGESLTSKNSFPAASLPSGERKTKENPPLRQKLRAGTAYAFGELWGDLAGWFFLGLLLAGVISVLAPETLFRGYLSGGISAMLLMLAFGIPLYICATASTPIAAALIGKGVSPGATLVFLLTGPATNAATLTVLTKLLGRRTTMIYLAAIAVVSVLCGLALDSLYLALGIKATAVVGQAAELMPYPVRLGSALFLLAVSAKPLLKGFFTEKKTCGGKGGCC